nr:hypothetical protein [Embleya scabrispora]
MREALDHRVARSGERGVFARVFTRYGQPVLPGLIEQRPHHPQIVQFLDLLGVQPPGRVFPALFGDPAAQRELHAVVVDVDAVEGDAQVGVRAAVALGRA